MINSLLKNIIQSKKSINKKKFNQSSIPIWFTKSLKKNSLSLQKIIENISDEPSLHLVFKNNNLLKNFSEEYDKTTGLSGFIINRRKIKNLKNYEIGHWWVQDFSSMLPIYLSPEIKFKKVLDMCAAPGGKAFQELV